MIFLTNEEIKRMKLALNGHWISIKDDDGEVRHVYIPGDRPSSSKSKGTSKKEKSSSSKKSESYTSVRDMETKTKSNSFESAGVFSRGGGVIFQKDGSKDRVYFSDEEVRKMRGAILTHNHPSGNPFSKDDLDILFTANLYEIRAVGEKYTYVMTNPKWETSPNMYRRNFDTAIINQRYKMTEKTPDQDWKDFNHLVLQGFADMSGLKYQRIENVKD